MKIEFHANEVNDWCLGIQMARGQDEHGDFVMFEIGILFFSLLILKYN